MDLSAEDALRLNVLLANEPQAIRIDESRMSVHGLAADGESVIQLNPNCRDDNYLKRVREMLSSHVLGSPGGYPVYLRRWTRMGQARDTSLAKLLMLGEPEAVVAVVHAEGLTDDIARRAWWAMPTANNARRMLERECVARGSVGPLLAEYLIEYLPFETEHQDMINSVALVLKPGLIDEDTRASLWERARKRNTFYVGFLKAVPDELPRKRDPHPGLSSSRERLAELAGGNRYARQLLRTLDAPGQAFIETTEMALKKPTNQDVVVELMEVIRSYFSDACSDGSGIQDPDQIREQVETACAKPEPELNELLRQCPELEPATRAMLGLAEVGERLVSPVFARSDAIGTVMRRKLEHITNPMFQELAVLRGKA